ncbi:group II intron reverse transcriptase/maturase [Variovorax boronicumulans]|uniref:group II intron reverse transcriptase/maturase n=1 Tax=Variovorax boronicumulans TaxID=436515 RepID=UPI00278058AC|nr:group II intron reverse transcriptase/maturase [Variovorax boronicumulans]
MSYGRGKSDCCVVPKKLPNKAAGAIPVAAEVVEGRRQAKGNAIAARKSRRSMRTYDLGTALDGIRQTAKGRRDAKFTGLLHHIYAPERLRAAYNALKRDAAAGVDGQTWQSYGQALEENLLALSDRLARGGYRPNPVRRVYIDKADGSKRPLGVPALEDKIVQRATVEVLNAIYEQDFLGFSYGFRPQRSAHQALDAVAVGVSARKVNWILDADISKFFDTIERDWLVKFIEHRVADTRVVRLIKKWLHAGVLEDGRLTQSELGTVQGGSISPLLANIYLHYAFDLWVKQWRGRHARGDVIVVRYADDWVAGFQYRDDAERFQREVSDRLGRFGLRLHPEKTRLIEFGRFAGEDRRRRGQGKPQTFDFLGFTHCCGKTRQGKFVVLRLTSAKRLRNKLMAVKHELRRRMHLPIAAQGQYLQAVVTGHGRYFGVPFNSARLSTFRLKVARLWHRTLCRRSQHRRMPWSRMACFVQRWLPYLHICHPYPQQRLIVTTQGRSRMR